MVSAGRIREGLAGRLRVACGSLAGPCGSLPGAGKDLPARTGERRREETGKADREAHLVNGKAGRRPGSPDPSAETPTVLGRLVGIPTVLKLVQS